MKEYYFEVIFAISLVCSVMMDDANNHMMKFKRLCHKKYQGNCEGVRVSFF